VASLTERGLDVSGLALRIPCCLGDNCPSSAQTAPVGSSQVRLGGVSGECSLVGCSCGLWNDRENDHLSKRRACPTAPGREGHWLAARAVRPTGQADGGSAIRPWAPLDKRPAQASRYRPSSRVAVQSGFEHANSCTNVDTSSKAAGERICLSKSSENLALFNNGGNGHSVPSTVPASSTSPPLRIADSG
jgi:hypothetical protein